MHRSELRPPTKRMRSAGAFRLLALIAVYCLGCSADAPPASKSRKIGEDAECLSENRLLSRSKFGSFQKGRLLDAVLNDVRFSGNFEMAARHDGKWISAISYALFSVDARNDGGEVVWAIFVDDRFEKFVRWPKWEMVDVTVDGAVRSRPKRMNVGNFDRLIRALQSPAIDLAQLEKEWDARPTEPQQYDPGLTAIGVVLGPFIRSASDKDFVENAKLRDRFNAARLKFKMNESKVESTFGEKPLVSTVIDSRQYSVFGESRSFEIVHSLHYANVLVLYENGELTGVYSGESMPGGDAGIRKSRTTFIDFPKD